MPAPRTPATWVALVGATWASAPSAARASGDCASAPCLDAQLQWLAPGREGATVVGAERTLTRGRATAAMALGWMSRPIVLVAPSPDPDGRELNVVDHALDLTWLLGLGVGAGVQLELAAPVVVWQSGAGADAAVSSLPQPLPTTAVRDPRLGLSAQVVGDRTSALGVAARVVLSAPLGDEAALAGGDGAVLAPELALGWRRGRWQLAAALGARLRSRVHVATNVVDDQVVAEVGGKLRLLAEETLFVTIGGWVGPVLAPPPAGSAGAPGEWSLGLGSRPAPRLALHLSGGSGLPLGVDGGFALGTPRARATLVVAVETE